MSEVIKEVFGLYKEKTKLPIVSTYVILLIVWNWDILSIYLFASVNMETRICWIKNLVPGFWNHLWRILIPIAISFLYPLTAKYLTDFNNKLTKKVDTDLFNFTKNKRLNNASLEYKIESEKTGKKDLETLRVEKEAMQLTIDSLTSKLDEANESIKTKDEKINDLDNKNKDLNSNYQTVSQKLEKLENQNSNIDDDIDLIHQFNEDFKGIDYNSIYDVLNLIINKEEFILSIESNRGILNFENIKLKLIKNKYIEEPLDAYERYELTYKGKICYIYLEGKRKR